MSTEKILRKLESTGFKVEFDKETFKYSDTRGAMEFESASLNGLYNKIKLNLDL